MAYQMINLKEYQQFSSISEMNHHVKEFNKELSSRHYETLNLLAQYSCKVVGVSHLKIETIAKKLNKSISTIKRHLSFLKKNGFISVINTSRIKKGGKGANIFIISSVKTRSKIKNELSKMNHRKDSQKDSQTLSQQALAFVKIKKETMFFKAINNSFISTSKKRKAHLKRIENIKNYRQCPNNVPLSLYKVNTPFFTDKQISTLYTIINKSINDYGTLSDKQIETIIEDTFKAIIVAMRNHYKYHKAPINNMFAYAVVTAKNLTVKHVNQTMWSFL